MTRAEYKEARATLGWTHARIASTVGVAIRTPYRWQAGEAPIQEPEARLLRLLVLLRLTTSERKFNEIVGELCVRS